MAKWTKRILLTLGILFVLLLAAAVLIPILFKDKIEAAVKVEVNKNINAAVDWGEWDITIFKSFPDLTVEVADVKVSNVAPFEGIDLARIGTLTATVDIKSVFDDKIDIKRIGLVKPHIHVKVLEDGRANWDIAKADSSASDAPVDTATTAFHVGLREYWIEDGSLIYDDASLTYLMELKGLDHTGSGDFTQDLFTLSTVTHADSATVVFDGIKYLRNVKADITADLDMDMPNMKFTFKNNEATINQLVLGFDGWLAMPADDIDMDLTWSAKKTDFGTLLSLVPAEFATDLTGAQMSGKAGFSGHVKGTYNETSMPGFGVTVDVDNGRFKYPDLPAAVENIFVDLKINSPGGSDMDKMVVDLKRFAMKMAGNPVEARMYLTTPHERPQRGCGDQGRPGPFQCEEGGADGRGAEGLLQGRCTHERPDERCGRRSLRQLQGRWHHDVTRDGLSERFAARGGHHRIGLLLQPALSGAHQVRGQFGHKQPASPRPHGQLPAMVA